MSTGKDPTLSTSLAAAVCVPGLLMAVATSAVLAMAAAGWHPLWPDEPLTLSEAAALRDAGAVAHMLDAGVDANRRWNVRSGVLNDGEGPMLPVEAAVAASRPEIVALLLANDRPVDAEQRRRLFCLAERKRDRDVTAELVRRIGQPPAVLRCEATP